jgi:hypothetical protein
VAETLKETAVKENDQDFEENINTDKETTQPITKNEQKEKQSLEIRHCGKSRAKQNKNRVPQSTKRM